VPAPHGASAQPSTFLQRPPSTTKPLAQVVQVSLLLLVQLTVVQDAIASQRAQVAPSSKWPTGHVQL